MFDGSQPSGQAMATKNAFTALPPAPGYDAVVHRQESTHKVPKSSSHVVLSRIERSPPFMQLAEHLAVLCACCTRRLLGR